jgi:hypothetical protein
MSTPHCIPAELWRAARDKREHDQATLEHLASCPDCSVLWETIRLFPQAQLARLDHAPSGWIERAMAIAPGKKAAGKLAKLVAMLQFDSWATPSLAVLRGASDLPSRRLSWEVESWSIDVRAEDTGSGWSCTAQVLEGGQPQSGVEIRSGAVKVRTDNAGLATWTSARPPRVLHASDDSRSVQLGPLSWQPPKRT